MRGAFAQHLDSEPGEDPGTASSLRVPEAISEDVRIRSLSTGTAPAIKEQIAAEEAEDGWITWTILMQRDVVG